mmetsp:Transcript_33057/g.54589  ORF Transcript_33057/g.54589 Transcript_33057/m.54589 type:complete len:105 (+) Transcript_33057:2-316(+)
MKESYKVQPVSNKDIFVGSLDEFHNSGCTKVPGVGNQKRKRLKDQGIATVRQLLAAKEADVPYVKNAVEELKSTLSRMSGADSWQSMHQFVIGIDYSHGSNTAA